MRNIGKWLVLGAGIGVLAGLSSAMLLESLYWATDTRVANDWLLYALPFAGLAVGLIYHYGAGESVRGNNLILDEIHDAKGAIPRRMAPLVFAATVATHLFGGSAGREGTAIQMSASLNDGVISRLAKLDASDRRQLLIAAISGGFGAVFGVPIAGFIFGLEVQTAGRVRTETVIGALTASVVGNEVVHRLGVGHTPVPQIPTPEFDLAFVIQILVAGLAFALAAAAFTEMTHGFRALFARFVLWPPLRPFLGGVAVIALTAAVGTRDYLGLSVPLIVDSLNPAVEVALFAFAWKLLFTALTLGAGFQGGEVTPLFVIGATLGASLGHLFGADVALFAAIGFVAVFAGATNTPLACTIMGVEMFGAGAIVPFAICCALSYSLSGDGGIYSAQRSVRGSSPESLST